MVHPGVKLKTLVYVAHINLETQGRGKGRLGGLGGGLQRGLYTIEHKTPLVFLPSVNRLTVVNCTRSQAVKRSQAWLPVCTWTHTKIINYIEIFDIAWGFGCRLAVVPRTNVSKKKKRKQSNPPHTLTLILIRVTDTVSSIMWIPSLKIQSWGSECMLARCTSTAMQFLTWLENRYKGACKLLPQARRPERHSSVLEWHYQGSL